MIIMIVVIIMIILLKTIHDNNSNNNNKINNNNRVLPLPNSLFYNGLIDIVVHKVNKGTLNKII